MNKKSVALGNCFQNGFKYLFSSKGNEDMLLVHGTVSGQKHIEGIRYEHCWVEYCEQHIVDSQIVNLWMVVDPSQDMEKPVVCPRELYYKIARVIELNVKKYSRVDALLFAAKQMHYGNWEDLGE